MLKSLSIKNVALFEECNVTLDAGLTVLSGETGAGKSIVIDSLTFLLGGRADKSLIRYGAETASVEGVFEVDDSLFPVMRELGLEEENLVIVKRTMSETRNEVRVNGNAFTLAMLRRLTSQMVDILGQHEHQSLLKTSTHLALLDKFEPSIHAFIEEYVGLHTRYKSLLKELSSFGDEGYRLRRKETLEYQIADIQKADPKPEEEEELLQTREKYRNAEKYIQGLSGAYNALESEEIGVGVLLSRALQALRPISRLDDGLQELESRLESAKIELQDIKDTLYSYAESFSFDERTAERVERRVDQLKLLKRKYGATIEIVLQELEKMQAEYDEIAGADERIEALQKELEKCKKNLYQSAVALSKKRREAAKAFEQAIVRELNDLAMKGTRFEVSFSDMPGEEAFEEALTENGIDQVEFLISPNVGEPLRSLSKIASGGEMSRFMLAVKNIIAGLDNIETLVFDEIDTGISGRVAETVAQKLSNISVGRQVVAVTHLPILAAYADHHSLISKGVEGGKTRTTLTPLEGEARVSEVARLTGAETQNGKIHAKEMMESAAKYKQSLKA